MQCDRCGKPDHAHDELYRHRGLYLASRTLCRDCLMMYIDQQTGWRMVLFAIVGVAALFASHTVNVQSWVLLNMVLVSVFYCAGFVIHECGHALGALLTGQRVLIISIGRGRKWLQFRCGSTIVKIHVLPLDGYSQFTPRGGGFPRTRKWFAVFMGPFSNVIAAILACIALHYTSMSEHFISTPAPLTAFMLANVLLAVINLLPFEVNTPDGAFRSDGQLLWDVWREKR